MLKEMLATHGVVLLAVLSLTGCKPESVATDGAMEPFAITDANFQIEVLDSNQPVLVDFWAARCPPCLEMKPTVRRLVADFAGLAVIGQVDVDANPQVPEKYGVRLLPTVLIFFKGEVVRRLDGLHTKDELERAINAVTSPVQRADRGNSTDHSISSP